MIASRTDGSQRLARSEVATVRLKSWCQRGRAGGSGVRTDRVLPITNHGVPAEVIGGAWRAARTFFDRPEAEKMALALDDREGLTANLPQYYPFQEEALAAGLGVKTPGDLKEPIGFGPNDGGRPWPAGELSPAMERYSSAMLDLGARLRRVLLEALGRPADILDDLFPPNGGASYLRAINYPEQEDVLPLQMRAGAHTDYDCLTILRSQDSAGGLQVKDRDGEWIDVQGLDDSFVINIADAMGVWSNDRFVSTLHRVVTPPDALVAGSRRQSIAFFYNPAADALIEPIVAQGTQAHYDPITCQELQDRKVQVTHETM
jgi:isopenicillin N synthase-like dioxygenase